MPGDDFQHPALARAATGLAKLRAAGAVVGSPDPVAALHHMDCSPPGVLALAEPVGRGANQLDTAHSQYHQGRSTALRSWSGQAAADFDQQSAATDSEYGATQSRTEDLHTAGLHIASGLDGLADGTADQALRIADNADAAATFVLTQQPDAPGYTEAALTVNSACLDVVNEVSAHVAQIPELENYLAGLLPGDSSGDAGPGAGVGAERSRS